MFPLKFTNPSHEYLKIFFLVLIFTSSTWSLNHNSIMLNNIQRLDHITLGSCNNQLFPQPHWKAMKKLSPDLFIFGGDNIYGDYKYTFKKLEKDYWLQNSHPGYMEFKKTVPIIGIWDDHDYGLNNGGAEFSGKKASQKDFFDFMMVEADSPRRNQDGIYTTYVFGSKGQQVKIILLDGRYFRTKNTILGEKQWLWLENEIKDSRAKFHLIINGTAIFYPNYKKGEEWVDVPGEKEKLIALLEKHKPSGTLLISGDKHSSAFIKASINGKIYHEFMVSGMTHSMIGKRPKSSQLSRQTKEKVNFDIYVGRNFGEILFNWEENPSMTLNIRGAKYGKIKKSRTLKLSDM